MEPRVIHNSNSDDVGLLNLNSQRHCENGDHNVIGKDNHPVNMKSNQENIGKMRSLQESLSYESKEQHLTSSREISVVPTMDNPVPCNRSGCKIISLEPATAATYSPIKDTSPVKDTSPTKSTNPTKDTRPTKATSPVKDTSLVKDTSPIKDTSPVKDTSPNKDTTLVKKTEIQTENNLDCVDDSIEEWKDIDQLTDFPFYVLQAITDNFNENNYRDGGNLIGLGGFGTVFIGIFNTGFQVAVKCLKDSGDDSFDQFKAEVKALATFKHENLVRLHGYSKAENGPCCLVYDYMSNGSLEERIACHYDTAPLSNNIRLEILTGTAKGIEFLHKGGLIHRDIKSANILLDDNFKPKVGDFATARIFPKEMNTLIMQASAVIGTRPYMAPEALSFVIHPSMDSFSFGVVILEILTGLPVTDLSREEVDLKVYVQEHCCAGEDDEEAGTIYDLLDQRGGAWTKSTVDRLYSISCRCLEHILKKRLKMAKIVTELESLV
uniref:non-specific serine/threonine protein kinase n=1 Tax=Arion vulgaris TaxID=1028688 RepID=A0A0B7AD20_9EUPU